MSAIAEILRSVMRMYGSLRVCLHALRVRHHVRRDVALVELHAFFQLELGLRRLRLFDRDDAVFRDLVHRIGDDLADGAILRRDGGDSRDIFIASRPGASSS